MQAWAVLAKEVVQAEHPGFELVMSFAVFPETNGRRSARALTPEQTSCLLRPARTFSVDERLLEN